MKKIIRSFSSFATLQVLIVLLVILSVNQSDLEANPSIVKELKDDDSSIPSSVDVEPFSGSDSFSVNTKSFSDLYSLEIKKFWSLIEEKSLSESPFRHGVVLFCLSFSFSFLMIFILFGGEVIFIENYKKGSISRVNNLLKNEVQNIC